jgi:hypothetical protein
VPGVEDVSLPAKFIVSLLVSVPAPSSVGFPTFVAQYHA